MKKVNFIESIEGKLNRKLFKGEKKPRWEFFGEKFIGVFSSKKWL